MNISMNVRKTGSRVLAAVALAAGFLFMGSMFTPGGTHAGSGPGRVDPHAGLTSLGSIEDDRLHAFIFATDEGVRYSVYDRVNGATLAELIDEATVRRLFPELPLGDSDGGTPATRVMLVDP